MQGVKQALSQIRKDLGGLVFEATIILAQVEEQLTQSVTDPRRLLPHTQLIDRLKLVFAPESFGYDWPTYRSRIVNPDMIGSLGLLDADLPGPILSATDIVFINQDVQRLQQKVRKSNLSPSWSALLTGQLDLIERSIARVNADGFANFNEVVFCAVGRLELELKVGRHDADAAEVIREIVDDVLRIAGLAQVGAVGAPAIPFLTKIAGLLTGPSTS